MTIDVRASGNDFELFQVQVGGGVRTLSLDELDAAFQAGVIDEQTMVLRSGSIRWMTLAEIAGLEEEQQPNSLAPFATDVAYANVSIPPLPPIGELTLATAEIAAFRPKRPIGPVLAVAAMLALIGGVSFGATRYGVSGLKAQLASVMHGKSLENARSVAIAAPPVEAPKAEPPPAAVETLPAPAAAAPAPWAAALESSTPAKADNSTPAKAEKKGKKSAPATPRKRAKGKGAASDPTTRGSGQFDPLNGNL